MKSLIPVISALLLLGCSNEASKSESTTQLSTPPSAIEENVTESSTETTPSPVEEASSASSQPAASTPPVAQAAAPTPTPKAAQTAAPKAPVAASVDGGALYSQKCASCHGVKAEKAALNKSQIIANFSEAQVKEALKGYQAGTYGKEMKTLMQGQAKGLNDAQVDALAKHISTL